MPASSHGPSSDRDIGKGRLPWAQFYTASDSFIEKEYLPPGVQLRDPSRMIQQEIDIIYTHWLDRQREGKSPLRFHPGERQGRKASEGCDLVQDQSRRGEGSGKGGICMVENHGN